MLASEDEILGIDYDEDLDVVVVRTKHETNFEDKLRKKTLTSGCAQGTAFGDLMERFEDVVLSPNAVLKTSWLYALTKTINTTPSLYLEAGAIHGCVLAEGDRPLLYMEDVGRHNAVDKVLGHELASDRLPLEECVLMVSGRASFEILQKALAGRVGMICAVSAPSSLAVEFARENGQTLVGFLRGDTFNVYSHPERIAGLVR